MATRLVLRGEAGGQPRPNPGFTVRRRSGLRGSYKRISFRDERHKASTLVDTRDIHSGPVEFVLLKQKLPSVRQSASVV